MVATTFSFLRDHRSVMNQGSVIVITLGAFVSGVMGAVARLKRVNPNGPGERERPPSVLTR